MITYLQQMKQAQRKENDGMVRADGPNSIMMSLNQILMKRQVRDSIHRQLIRAMRLLIF